MFSENTASILANWKSPNKQSPHRHGDAQRTVSDPGMRRSPLSFRFATQTFEALRPLCVLADHPFLFTPERLGIGYVLLLTHLMVTGFLTWVSRFFTDAVPESPHAHRITRALRRFSPKNQSRKSGSGSSQKSPRKPALTVVGPRRILVVDPALASIKAASASASVRRASLA